MSVARLTSKGQVTIPKEIRVHLDLRKGCEVEFLIEPDGAVRVRPKARPARSLFGVLGVPGKPRSVDEMEESSLEHLAEEDRRIREGRP